MMRTRILGCVFLPLLVGSLALCGCSSDDSDDSGSGSPREGVFLDSAVQNLRFESGSEIGTTDGDGTFHYPSSAAQISFYVGDIQIGSGSPAASMTPLSFSSSGLGLADPLVINVARFLQTIDDDGDTSNGIQIAEDSHTAAIGGSVNFNQSVLDFEDDSNVQDLVADLTGATSAGERNLIPADDATQHLQQTLAAQFQGQHTGIYCRDPEQEGGSATKVGNWSMTIDGSNVSMSFSGTPSFSATGTINSDGTTSLDGSGGVYVYVSYDGEFWGRWYGETASGSITQGSSCSSH